MQVAAAYCDSIWTVNLLLTLGSWYICVLGPIGIKYIIFDHHKRRPLYQVIHVIHKEYRTNTVDAIYYDYE